MIQAIGLTSAPRRGRSPAVDDLTFEARPGRVTVLLGPEGAGKSTALRLMLRLRPGRGVALFRGRPLHRVPHPPREIGTLLGDVPGHPGRTARGHLRMLAAACGVPSGRADDVLDVVGLSGLADHRLGSFSLGMDRRLGLAAALLGDPHTLVLDDPAAGLSARERAWLHGLLRGYAEQGGAVLLTASEPKEAVGVADRVVSLEAGRLVADQECPDFARTRLRPRVVVCTPHTDRLAAVLTQEFRASRTDAGGERTEIVRESGSRLAVYGSSCATVGETAYRHRILVHLLTEELGDAGDRERAGPLHRADGRAVVGASRGEAVTAVPAAPTAPAGGVPAERGPVPPRMPVLPPPGPAWPLRYELRRWAGVRAGWWIMAAALLIGLLGAFWQALTGAPASDRVLTGWVPPLPLPPVAVAAGLLGALSFAQEFRYPALVPAQVPVPRRLSLLLGKTAVAGAAALLLCGAGVALNRAALTLLMGPEAPVGMPEWPVLAGLAALPVCCAWAGLLAAGVFRSVLAGLAAVTAVPLVLAPALRHLLEGPAARSIEGFPARLQALTGLPLPTAAERWLAAGVPHATQPVGWAFALSLVVLLAGYAVVGLRRGPR
ncbi:hypothetical protein GCM10009716_34600 [Streptomyces sodiiphilus]|uniref:ABC transporter domain-containing protein n=1 Tax=Streptomyces sodiiphilus TaxID=226217 RepID=A0ABN2PJ69_9ACTN